MPVDANLNINNVRSIGVVMFGLMGDVILRTPLLREIRKAFPRATITCIVDPIGMDVLQLSASVDCLIPTNRKVSGLNYLLEKLKLQLRVIAARFDLLIDFYGGASSAGLVALSCAKHRMIVRDATVTSNTPTRGNLSRPEAKNPFHTINGAFEILKFFDYPNKSVDTSPDLTCAIKTNENWRFGLEMPGTNFYVVSLGSGDPKKYINCSTLSQLCRWLFSRHNLIPVIVQNPGQEGLQRDLSGLLEKFRVPHRNLPALSLEDLSLILLDSKFLIVPDTGLFHFGLALRIPVLGVFTYTHPLLVTPDNRLVEFCFREDQKSNATLGGLPVGTPDLSVRELIRSCKALLTRIEKIPSTILTNVNTPTSISHKNAQHQ